MYVDGSFCIMEKEGQLYVLAHGTVVVEVESYAAGLELIRQLKKETGKDE
jgi:hypothetical protein